MSVRKTAAKVEEHFSWETWVGPAEKANSFLRESGEQCFLERVAACASSGLFFVTSEDLKARAEEVGGEGSEAGLATCWPSSMMESRTLAMKSGIEE